MKKILKLTTLMLMASALLTTLSLTSCSESDKQDKNDEELEVFTPEFTALETSYDLKIGETLCSLFDLELEYVGADGIPVRTPIAAEQIVKVTIPAAKVPEILDFRLCGKLKKELEDTQTYDYVYKITARATAFDQRGDVYKKYDKEVIIAAENEMTGKKLKQFSERGFIVFSHFKVAFSDSKK